jgi:hypothetical protein
MDVVANAIMLKNVADLTEALNAMAEDGFTITRDLRKENLCGNKMVC